MEVKCLRVCQQKVAGVFAVLPALFPNHMGNILTPEGDFFLKAPDSTIIGKQIELVQGVGVYTHYIFLLRLNVGGFY